MWMEGWLTIWRWIFHADAEQRIYLVGYKKLIAKTYLLISYGFHQPDHRFFQSVNLNKKSNRNVSLFLGALKNTYFRMRSFSQTLLGLIAYCTVYMRNRNRSMRDRCERQLKDTCVFKMFIRISPIFLSVH